MLCEWKKAASKLEATNTSFSKWSFELVIQMHTTRSGSFDQNLIVINYET